MLLALELAQPLLIGFEPSLEALDIVGRRLCRGRRILRGVLRTSGGGGSEQRYGNSREGQRGDAQSAGSKQHTFSLSCARVRELGCAMRGHSPLTLGEPG